MELQNPQQPCGLPIDVPALDHNTSDETSSSQHRGILQERSANWPHEHHHIAATPPLKESRSPSPADKGYARRATNSGGYFNGNVHAQHFGLTGIGVERPEKQIRYELERLYKMLQRSDKYQKYREKQPVLTPAEFLAREAAERKAAEQRGSKDEKEKSVWPEFLEHAFWRALVRWPPMGRKKYMLDGALRGRNELIQDSIYRDTGIRRCRKQVSSHLQVLKQHLRDQPAVLVYMATKEEDKKRHRGSEASHAYHTAHVRGRYPPHRAASSSKYGYNASNPHDWPQFGALQTNQILSGESNDGLSMSPYEVTDFTMLVENDDQPVHSFTQLSSTGRLDDLNVTDIASWRRQYPEFDFLRSQTEDWTKKNRKVLVCDASIKVMTETRPNETLSTTFILHSQRDLSPFESLECVTRFYDSGDIAPDPTFDGPHAHDLKEHRTPCHYNMPESGHLRIAFGSKFWVNRMLRYQGLRQKDESCVSRSLLRLTATQDVYGIHPGTGKAECVLTILWRFTQTRSSAEVGSMNWRAVNFGACLPPSEPKWIKEEDHLVAAMDDMEGSHEDMLDSASEPAETVLYHQPPTLPLDFANPLPVHQAYNVQPSHHPPQLSLDILASLPPELEHLNASAPTTATDYSQQSLPSSMCHSQSTVASFPQHDNDFDFHSGHITIAGAFDPLSSFGAHTDLDFDGLGLAVGENGELVSVPTRQDFSAAAAAAAAAAAGCYSINAKPGWHQGDLIRSLEQAAEQQQAQQQQQFHMYDAGHGHEMTLPGHDVYQQTEELVGHGLHEGLWNLQSPFHEDTSGGAGGLGVVGCGRKDSHTGLGLGMGVLELIERDQRTRGY